jgi:hypothetical protein
MTLSDLRKKEVSEQVERVVLTEEEIKEAIRQGKIKKLFHERNKDKWPTDDGGRHSPNRETSENT